MATSNKIDELIKTILKRKYTLFTFDKEQFFAYKKQKICNHDVILNISCLPDFINFTLLCKVYSQEQYVKINKQVLKVFINDTKIPSWYFYESVLSDLRNSLQEFLENES